MVKAAKFFCRLGKKPGTKFFMDRIYSSGCVLTLGRHLSGLSLSGSRRLFQRWSQFGRSPVKLVHIFTRWSPHLVATFSVVTVQSRKPVFNNRGFFFSTFRLSSNLSAVLESFIFFPSPNCTYKYHFVPFASVSRLDLDMGHEE